MDDGKKLGTKMENYFRDICCLYMSESRNEKIGGVGLVVEIDETKIFKQNNHTGRLSIEQERCEWLLSGIWRESKETFF